MRAQQTSERVPIVQMQDICKTFNNVVHASKNVSFTLQEGEVHAILGENGAGKTTLMNMLYGLLIPDSGQIYYKGTPVKINSPNDAIALKIGMVHQEFKLVQPLTVLQNVILGAEPKRLGFIDVGRARKEVSSLAQQFGFQIDLDAIVEDIPVAAAQKVEILKALYRKADVLILDEPTAVLIPSEIEQLGVTLRKLSNEGKSIILITHKLPEIKQMADICTILRRGENVDIITPATTSEEEMASLMVGHHIDLNREKTPSPFALTPENVALSVSKLCERAPKGKKGALKDVTFEIHKGEIFGIAGVDGNGQEALVNNLVGMEKPQSGSILLNGLEIAGLSVKSIIRAGVAAVHSDRSKRGSIPSFSISENIALERFDDERYSNKWGLLRFKNMEEDAKAVIKEFDIRPPVPSYRTISLSGGNQQKVIVGRQVFAQRDLLIAFQPTRGLDVGAISLLHDAILKEREAGKAVLLISYELSEIMSLSDTVGVMYEGQISKIIPGGQFDEAVLGYYMGGGQDK